MWFKNKSRKRFGSAALAAVMAVTSAQVCSIGTVAFAEEEDGSQTFEEELLPADKLETGIVAETGDAWNQVEGLTKTKYKAGDKLVYTFEWIDKELAASSEKGNNGLKLGYTIKWGEWDFFVDEWGTYKGDETTFEVVLTEEQAANMSTVLALCFCGQNVKFTSLKRVYTLTADEIKYIGYVDASRTKDQVTGSEPDYGWAGRTMLDCSKAQAGDKIVVSVLDINENTEIRIAETNTPYKAFGEQEYTKENGKGGKLTPETFEYVLKEEDFDRINHKGQYNKGTVEIAGLACWFRAQLVPKGEEVTYLISASTSDNGTVDVAEKAAADEDVTVKVTPNKGCEVTSVTVKDADGGEIEVTKGDAGYTFKMPAKAVSVNAVIDKIEYTVTATADDNGTVALEKVIEGGNKPVDKTANYEDVIKITCTPKDKDNYIVDTVKVTDAAGTEIKVNNFTFTMPDSNVTIAVTFAKVDPNTEYEVKIENPEKGGKVEAAPAKAKKDTEITLTVTPDEGYALDTMTAIDGNGQPVEIKDNKFTMPIGGITITPAFKAVDYKVTVAAVENGTVKVSKETANIGDTITITVTPAKGYKVTKVTAGEDEVKADDKGKYAFTMPAKDVEVKAEFEKLPEDTSGDTSDGSGSSDSAVTTPTSFALKKNGTTSITLSWKKVANATGYTIQQQSGKTWKTVANVKKGATVTAKITKLKAATTYKFRICANGTKDSAYSKALSVTTQPTKAASVKPSKATKNSITLKWKKNKTATGYQVQQKNGKKWKTLKTINKNKTVKATIKKLKKNKTYTFRVRTFKKVGKTKVFGAATTVKVKTKK